MRVAVVHVQLDRKHADVAFVQHPGHRLLQRKDAELAQHVEGAQDRMARERDFLGGREDSDLRRSRRIRRRKREDGLGEIHFPCDPLQLRIAEAGRAQHHGDGISAEGLVGEDIGLIATEDAWLRIHDRGRTVGERLGFVNARLAPCLEAALGRDAVTPVPEAPRRIGSAGFSGSLRRNVAVTRAGRDACWQSGCRSCGALSPSPRSFS